MKLKLLLLLLSSGFVFTSKAQDVLIVDCPDSLNFSKFNYVLRMGDYSNTPLEGFSTNEWVISKNNERKEFHLQNIENSRPRWIEIVFIIYVNDDRSSFAFKHVQEIIVAKDRLTHVWISPFKGTMLSEGYLKELSLEEAIDSLAHQRTLIVELPTLLDSEQFHHSLNVSWDDSEPVTYTDEGTSRNLTEDYQIEEYRIVKRRDSMLNISVNIRELKTGNVLTTKAERLELMSDTTSIEISTFDEEKVKNYFKNLAKERAKRKRSYLWQAFKDIPTDWKSRIAIASFYQGHKPYGEVLFGVARYIEATPMIDMFKRNRRTIPGVIWGPVLGTEFNFNWNKDKFILGPKIGFHGSGRFLNAGIHAVYYTDFNQGSIYLKPRVGINFGIPFINLSYSYAIRLGPDYFGNRVNLHQLCINGIIPIKLEEW